MDSKVLWSGVVVMTVMAIMIQVSGSDASPMAAGTSVLLWIALASEKG